jgi:hypothetical protein
MPYIPRSPLQPLDFLPRQKMLASQQPRNEADLRKVLDRLHLEVRVEDAVAARHGAVVGEQHAIVRLDVLADRLRQLRGRGCAVLRDRNASERGHDLGEHGARQRDARNRKARRRWRMRMHDGVDVGTLPVDFQMHRQLG